MSSLCGERELSVLLCYEGKLVAALKKEDMSLCQRLYERVVISKEVKDNFASLDHDNLKMELMVRYLLRHVYDAVKDNKLVLYSFLDVLCEFDERVAGELRRIGIKSSRRTTPISAIIINTRFKRACA